MAPKDLEFKKLLRFESDIEEEISDMDYNDFWDTYCQVSSADSENQFVIVTSPPLSSADGALTSKDENVK